MYSNCGAFVQTACTLGDNLVSTLYIQYQPVQLCKFGYNLVQGCYKVDKVVTRLFLSYGLCCNDAS